MTSRDLPGFEAATDQTIQPNVTMGWRDAAGLESMTNNRPFFNPNGLRAGVTTLATVMDAGAGVVDPVLPALTSPGTLEAVSSAAGDTGTFFVVCHYIDSLGFYRQAFSILTGTTPAPFTPQNGGPPVTDALRVNHFFAVNTADPDTPPAGDITVTIGGVLQRFAPAGRGIPDGAYLTTPRGFFGFLEGFEVTATADARVDFQARFPLNGGAQDGLINAADVVLGSWITITRMLVPMGPAAEWRFAIPFTIPTLADVRFRAEAVAGAAEVNVLPRISLIANNPTVDPNPELQPEAGE